MSTIWYPASPPGEGTLPGPYTDTAVEGDGNFYSYWGWPPQWRNVMVRCVTHSSPNLPLASGTNRLPIILHSHGYTCDRTLNSQIAAELASHGYIVIAVDHEDCHATVYPDNRGARYVPPGTRTDGSVLAQSRTADINYLLGHLAQMDSLDPVLAGRLDLDRVGTMGFSFGGGTAAEVARIDSRVKCAGLLDPYIDPGLFPTLASQGLQKPFLIINSTIWTHASLLASPSDFSLFGQTLFNQTRTNAVWFRTTGIGHFGLSDLAWTQEMTALSRQAAVAVNAGLLWFFNTYLKEESWPFPTNPEITKVQRK